LDLNDPKDEKGQIDEEKGAEVEEKTEKLPPKVIDTNLLRAFEYFDRSSVGYLRTDDVEILLHCLGHSYSRYFIRHLVYKVADSSHQYIYYKKLTEK